MRLVTVNPKIHLRFAVRLVAVLFASVAPTFVTGQTPETPKTSPAQSKEDWRAYEAKIRQHFTLLPDGGVIQMEANDPFDIQTRDAVRQRISEIENSFRRADFGTLSGDAGQTAAGTATMKRLKDQLRYSTENLPAGGQLRITTSNPEARNAVYDFLRFHIQQHKTDDSMADPVPSKRKHPANNLGHDAHPAPP